jgi:hypothetical protein
MDRVKPGDPLRLGAGFINETIDTNAKIRQGDLTLPNSRMNNFGIVTVRNDSDKDRKPFEGINIKELLIDVEKDGNIKTNGAFKGVLDNKIDMFSVCLSKIPKGKTGRAMLMGIIPARITMLSASHKFVKLKDGSLVSTSSGPARILGAQKDSGETWAMIYLGGTGSGGNDYTGFFRVEPDDEKENTINIVDGSDTLGDNCGIYVSGIDKIVVPKKSLTITAESYIMLYATYADNKWTIEIKAESSMPDFTEDKFTALLGIVKWDTENNKMGQAIQIWNNGIIYNNRYS